MTKTKKNIPEKKREDEAFLSKNHSKSVRFRLRVQEEKEADNEIKEHEQDNSRNPRVY